MQLLITGGLGFVGTNLVGHLLNRGDTCRILDNFSVGTLESLEDMLDGENIPRGHRSRIDILRGDVLCEDDALRATRDCDAVIHLAAQTNVVESVERPADSFRSNAIGTLNVLEGARINGVQRVVIASSNAAAGEVPPPIHEGVVPRPISAYGASKLAGEALASGYAASYGMHTFSLRFSNVYGPYSLHKGSVVALFLKQIMRQEVLSLYDAGRPTRDYIHVSDIVQAIEKAIMAGSPGSVYQIGTGIETSTRELVETISKVTGLRLRTRDAPPRPGEITRNLSDITKARMELSFQPNVPLEEGIGSLWPWFQTTYSPKC